MAYRASSYAHCFCCIKRHPQALAVCCVASGSRVQYAQSLFSFLRRTRPRARVSRHLSPCPRFSPVFANAATQSRSQYVYHFCDRSQTSSGHISINERLRGVPRETQRIWNWRPAPDRLPHSFPRYPSHLSRYDRSKFETCHESDTHNIGSARERHPVAWRLPVGGRQGCIIHGGIPCIFILCSRIFVFMYVCIGVSYV